MSQYLTVRIDTSDLLKCAHCNGEPEFRDGSSTRPYIRCKSCGMRTGSSYDYDKLKKIWNCRSTSEDAKLRELLVELYECSRQYGCNRCGYKDGCVIFDRMSELGINVSR